MTKITYASTGKTKNDLNFPFPFDCGSLALVLPVALQGLRQGHSPARPPGGAVVGGAVLWNYLPNTGIAASYLDYVGRRQGISRVRAIQECWIDSASGPCSLTMP